MTLLTAAAMTTGTMSVTVSAADVAADEASGTCGRGLLWEVNGDTLYIGLDAEYKHDPGRLRDRGNTWFVAYYNGSGLESDRINTLPWDKYADDIKNVVLGEGIFNVGSHMFDKLYNLVNVELSSTCGGLCSYAIPDSVSEIYLPFDDSFRLSENSVGPNTTIYGYRNSFADFDAIEYDLNFEYIGEASEPCWTIDGQVGSNAYWHFNTETRTLEITGTGTISKLYPFGLYRYTENIAVGEGITEIDDTFVRRSSDSDKAWDWPQVKTVSLPDSLEKISEDSFQYLSNAVNVADGTPISEFKCETMEPVVTDDNATYGDTNLDGKIGLMDVLAMQKYCANTITLNEEALKNSDVTLDGVVNMSDASTLVAYMLRHIDQLPWPYDYINIDIAE